MHLAAVGAWARDLPRASATIPRAEFTVVADGYPLIRRSCAGCGALQEHECSGRFRVNANGKTIDIWLLYRCTRCAATSKLPVVERTPLARVDRRLLDRAAANDPELAARYARDLGLLRRHKARLASGDRWTLAPVDPGGPDLRPPSRVGFTLRPMLVVRADHLVAAALGWSRTAVTAAMRNGRLQLRSAGNPRTLRLWERCEWLIEA